MSLTLADELDFWAQDDLELDREATGIVCLTNSIYRRLQTPHGTLPSPLDPPDPADADAGTDLVGMLHLGQTVAGVLAIQSYVKAEVLKEAAVNPDTLSVVVDINFTTFPPTGAIAITGRALSGQAFALNVPVSELSSTQQTAAALSSGATQ